MRPNLPDLLTFPVERVDDQRLRDLLEEMAEALVSTNDPDTLRALGISLKMMGDFARSEAYTITRSCW